MKIKWYCDNCNVTFFTDYEEEEWEDEGAYGVCPECGTTFFQDIDYPEIEYAEEE